MTLPPSIENRIRLSDGRPTLPAADLAVVYGVSVRTLLECVRRRGPLAGEFAFISAASRPAENEGNDRRAGGGLVFTEHGAIAAAFLLGTEIALERSVQIVRAFARFRAGRADDQKEPGRDPAVYEPAGSYARA